MKPLTVLIGRNGSGKSNALDALEVLSRLARGEEVRDVLDGNRRGAGSVRGGAEGCAPHGSDTFEIGATVEDDDSLCAELDVRIQVRPRVLVVFEHLSADLGNRHVDLLTTREPDPGRSDLEASVYNGKRCRNPILSFRYLNGQGQLRRQCEAMVHALVHGSTTRPCALDLLTQGIGTGDIGILAEVDALRGRIPGATPVRIWTLDHGLAAHA